MTSIRLQLQNKLFQRIQPPAPADLRVFYIGGFWRGSNDMVAQMLNGLKATGVNVFDFNTDENHDALDTEGVPYDRGTSGPVWLVREKLFPLILEFRPHLILCNAGGLSFRPQDANTLRGWGVKLLGIALSDPDVYKPTTSKIFKNFDAMYTNDAQTAELYRQGGVPAFQMPIATNDGFFRPLPPAPEYACEVLHLGAAHQDRIEPVRALVEHFDTHVYGENWEKHDIHNRGLVYGEETLKALNSARVVVLFSRTPSGRQTVKVGIFDFLAAGALLATEDFPDLRQYFDVQKELIAFNGVDEMLAKIRYYLDHPGEAEAIRQAGRAKVMAQYTWKQTWPRILASVIRVKGWEASPVR
jgi:spore maturation protein CgeB